MKTFDCSVCGNRMVEAEGKGFVKIKYYNPETGVTDEGNVCWDCQNDSLNEILYELKMVG